MSRRDDPALAEIERVAQAITAREDDLRRLVVATMAAGVSVAGIAKAANVSRWTCYRWAEGES
jgi:DNA-directed RNA polymerase specialized sigma24 family protein